MHDVLVLSCTYAGRLYSTDSIMRDVAKIVNIYCGKVSTRIGGAIAIRALRYKYNTAGIHTSLACGVQSPNCTHETHTRST